MNAIDDLQRALSTKSELDKVNDEIIRSFLNDIAFYVNRNSYKKAIDASCHLFLHLAKRADIKPYTIIRKLYKANQS